VNYRLSNPLKAPSVPAAEADGLLKLSDLIAETSVDIPVWDGALARDGYQLLLNDWPIGKIQTFAPPGPIEGSTVTLSLDAAAYLIKSGLYKLAYRTFTFPFNNSIDSAATFIRVERAPPGAALLAPLILPGATLGNTLSALLPGYAGMALGDVIQARCNGVAGPAYTVQSEDLGIRLIEIHFKPEHLDLGDDHLTLDYTVTDRAGNVSARSVPKLLTLQM
jgi:hypothetical protein